jgi:hypothetical protein
MSQVLKKLLAIDALLSDERKWCKGTLARDQKGKPASTHHASAKRWCLLGAVDRITGRNDRIYEEVVSELQKAIREIDGECRNRVGVINFNDDDETDFLAIKEVLTIAICNNHPKNKHD